MLLNAILIYEGQFRQQERSPGPRHDHVKELRRKQTNEDREKEMTGN